MSGGTTKWFRLILEESHHAWVVVGEPMATRAALAGVLPSTTIYWETDQFGIDDSRQLKERQARCLVETDRQFWVFVWQTISLEAQNALLKTFEEPSPGQRFVILLDSLEGLLPTLLSRLAVLEVPAALAPATLARAEEFWQGKVADRLTLVSNLLREQEGRPARARAAALGLVAGLTTVARRREAPRPETVHRFRALGAARRRLGDRAALPRLILEHLATVL